MKVNEFAKRLGIGSSKVRYYDRIGLIQGSRNEENNYRDFNELDALNIYHARMLRSFDMSVEESIQAKDKKLDEINAWVDEHVADLENQIRWQEIKLLRLREMQGYFSLIQEHRHVSDYELEDSYNIWGFGKNVHPNRDVLDNLGILADKMPFSYIAVKVSKESVLSKSDELDVSLGLGILERNRQKLGLDSLKDIYKCKKGKGIHIMLEMENPFLLKKEDIEPLLTEMKKRNIHLDHDLIGRVFFSYQKNGKFIHVLGLGINMGK